MPELPDLTAYLHALRSRIFGRPLARVRLGNPFLLRSVDPPLEAFEGRRLNDVGLLGKRLALAFDDDDFLVIHLMIAGRLHWKAAGAKLPGKAGLAAFDFPDGTLVLTEAGSKRRASLHAVHGLAALLTNRSIQYRRVACVASYNREISSSSSWWVWRIGDNRAACRISSE